ncbi:MAG: ABC transporter ATP-binding protein [Candidatus Doudnabacteria bacterium]
MPLVKLENLRKVYNNGSDNQVIALKDINLTIEPGEFVAIMGPSGSGKSTLMHVIGFLDRPTSGGYFFEDQDVTRLTDNESADIRNEKIGFVFQSFNLLARTTALDNVILPMLYANKHTDAEMKTLGLKMLEQVNLSDRAKHHSAELSGGQQQRVAIARALINDPKVIFADEPTGNLDSKSSIEIMDLFKQLNDQGRTLIFVTHEEDIAAYAHRVIRLKDGEIIEDKREKR